MTVSMVPARILYCLFLSYDTIVRGSLIPFIYTIVISFLQLLSYAAMVAHRSTARCLCSQTTGTSSFERYGSNAIG